MNQRLAAKWLSEYRQYVEAAKQARFGSRERRAALDEAISRVEGVNYHLHDLLPDVALISYSTLLRDHVAALARVDRAEMLLHEWAMMTDDPDGDEQHALPRLSLRALGIVYLAASGHWSAGRYRDAVGNAAARLNEFTQKRIGRHDISDSKLMAEAFKPEPAEKGKARLRCPGNPKSETVRSMQAGAQLFAMGAFQAIRNPAIHWTGNGNPVNAFEQLATLSIVARWVRYWNLEIWSPPPPVLTPPMTATIRVVPGPSAAIQPDK